MHSVMHCGLHAFLLASLKHDPKAILELLQCVSLPVAVGSEYFDGDLDKRKEYFDRLVCDLDFSKQLKDIRPFPCVSIRGDRNSINLLKWNSG